MIWDRFSFRLRKRETLVCIRRTATRHKRGGEAEVTVTSKRHAQAVIKQKEQRDRKEKAASIGGAVRDPGERWVTRERRRAPGEGGFY